MGLDDKTILVTGASSGIGREIAFAAGDRGATVINADIRREPRTGDVPTDERIERQGGSAVFVETDVTELDEVVTAAEQANEYGGLDVVINNAGKAESYALTETSPENWQRSLDVNLTGVYHGCLAGVERLNRNDDGGAIVNVASVFGVIGAPNSFSYSATKGGVLALTRQLARDLAEENIRVNAVSPGFIETPLLAEDTHTGTRQYAEAQTPIGRIGDPSEVAEAVLFLASEKATYITGQNLIVDGGYTMG